MFELLMRFSILTVLIFFFNYCFSQDKILSEFEKIIDFNDIKFCEIPIAYIEKHDVKRISICDTIAIDLSLQNIVTVLKKHGKLDQKLDDSLIVINSKLNFYAINNQICMINKIKEDTFWDEYFVYLINKYDKRFICFVAQEGYYCSEEKIQNFDFYKIIVSNLTLGMVIPTLVTNMSKLHFFIYDKLSNKIIYKDTVCDKAFEAEKPYSWNVINKQVLELIYRIEKIIKYNAIQKG